ncbi:MAG TPA: chromosomal replication initiator protein DnaA [Caulobacteraceae bacterium]|jgi:chromosomal replication initiator protein|nr:chromosomal replication initiator protein DnaA [Caulobacteraceae bacterium]
MTSLANIGAPHWKAGADGVTGATTGAVWSSTCAALRGELGDNTYGSWIAQAQLRQGVDGALVVVTPTGIARDWIRRNAWRRIGELWIQNDPERRALHLNSRAEFEAEHGDTPCAVRPETREAVEAPALRPATIAVPAAARQPGLQERFTFDTFVPGPANEFALAVARRVASWADGCFNPVLFHGPYGFGKTHLLNAIAWEAGRARPDKRIVYLTAERFLSTFVRAVMDRSGAAFKDDLRTADLLLVDDVHFIGGKKSSQEELFHTLTALTGEGRRVVFSADRPPSALTEVDGRLRSHLGAGLVCGIEPADRALRLGILERKLALLSRELGVDGRVRPEVLQFLADRFSDSVRELEGGLNTLVARAGERLSKLSLDEAQTILRPHLARGEKRITVDDIQKATAEHFGMKQTDLLSERRTRAVARPRQAAMYLAKQMTTRSLPDIGRRFGGRDHTTVLHAVRRIEELKAGDPVLAADLEAIARKLRD